MNRRSFAASAAGLLLAPFAWFRAKNGVNRIEDHSAVQEPGYHKIASGPPLSWYMSQDDDSNDWFVALSENRSDLEWLDLVMHEYFGTRPLPRPKGALWSYCEVFRCRSTGWPGIRFKAYGGKRNLPVTVEAAIIFPPVDKIVADRDAAAIHRCLDLDVPSWGRDAAPFLQ